MAEPVATTTMQSWPYGDQPNPDLLSRIPLNARTVLDVGCGTGALGAAYKMFNPRARVLGLDANLGACRIAATRLDQVAHFDAEAGDLPFDLPHGIDCLIYGDTLEHFRDPWSLLRRHVASLSPDGTLLACVPNVEHWSMTASLLRGNWDYADSGLFDRSHLRWFSGAMMERMLREIGLFPVDVMPRIFEPDAARAFVGALTPSLQALGIDPGGLLGRSMPLQYVWRARRAPIQPIEVRSTMLPPVGGVTQVRVIDPIEALCADPALRASVLKDTLPTERASGPSILILHRPALTGDTGLQLLRHLLGLGYLLVTEFDDDPSGIPVLQRPDVWNFTGVHAVQTTTARLGERLRAFNPNVAVFPNGVRALRPPRNFTDPNRITFFFGGLNRENDWPPFLPALNAVAAAAGERLHFVIMHDRGLFDSLDTPRKRFVPLGSYAAYLDLLAQSEISFMPLSDNQFNRSKSDLKFVEAASCRVAALASPTVYAESIQDGVTGVLFHDPEELRQRLLQMLANPEAARAIGDAGRAWVREHRMLAYQVAERAAWYRSLWDRRETLAAELFARLPQLQG